MADPIVASRAPFGVDVEAGTSYWWCACGKSQTRPFCDGSHKGGPFTPAEYRATATAAVWFCGCKHSHKAPRCDGTRKTL
jgi:CDGSH iron-sulfur domain-containing protein 3